MKYIFIPYAARIISLAHKKKIAVYTSPVCVAIAFYFAGKKSGTSVAKEKIRLLAHNLIITTMHGPK